MRSTIYILVNQNTGETAAHTIIFSSDTHVEALLENRRKAAVDYGIVPDSEYVWKRSKNRWGIYI